MDLEENEPIIIDIGSGTVKAGMAGDDAPKHYIPMVIGTPKSKSALVGMDIKDCYVGAEVASKKSVLNVEYPVKAGLIEDMDGLNEILHSLFNNDMKIGTDELKMLITEPPNNDPKVREQLVQLLFEEHKVPKLYLGNQAVMSLFATGRTTGTVIDSGYGITHTVPIYEGFAIPHATTEVNICGQDLTEYMLQLWQQKWQDKWGSYEIDPDRDPIAYAEVLQKCEEMKIKHAKVASDFDAELKSANEGNGRSEIYKLPDQNEIIIREELIRCPEMLFQPGLSGKTGNQAEDGLPKHTFDSILKCENDIKRDLFKNIVLAGGCTMFKGMQERMRKEITALAPSNMTPDVSSPADRSYSCWLGGAILSQIKKFEDMWITKKEYDAEGAGIVHKKCF